MGEGIMEDELSRKAWVRVVLLLCLCVTAEVEGVAVRQVDVDGVTTAPLPDRYGSNSSRVEALQIADTQYKAAYNLRNSKGLLAAIIVTVGLILSHDQILSLGQSRNCLGDLANEKTHRTPESFKEISRTHTAVSSAMRINTWTPVLVTLVGCKTCHPPDDTGKHEYVSLIPYDSKTRRQDGIIAIMMHELEDVKMMDFDPIVSGDLLVAVDCYPIDEADSESMEWEKEGPNGPGLKSWLEDLRYSPSLSNAPPTRSMIMYHPKGEWCPSKDDSRIELIPSWKAASNATNGRRACQNPWPQCRDCDDGPLAWLRQHMHVDTDEDVATGDEDDDAEHYRKHEGSHLHLGHGRTLLGFERKGSDYVGSITCAIAVFSILWFTNRLTSAPFSNASNNTADYYLLHYALDPSYVQPDGSAKSLAWGLFYSVTVVTSSMIVLRGAQYVQEHTVVFRNVMIARRRYLLYVAVIVTTFSICLCAYAPAQLFLYSQRVTSKFEVEFDITNIVVGWLNYFLLVVFFVNTLVAFMKKEMGFSLEPMVNEQTGNLFLAVAEILGGVVGFTDQVRSSFGWNAGCEMSELGYTLRRIASEAPASFPAGATLELHCTESTLTFAEVFNLTYTQDPSKLDDGNMCSLTCSLGGRISETPIWCKDSGFARARWTLSSHRETQAPTLCPDNTTTPAAYRVGLSSIPIPKGGLIDPVEAYLARQSGAPAQAVSARMPAASKTPTEPFVGAPDSANAAPDATTQANPQ